MSEQTFIVGTVVCNKPGVLHKISNMFRRRNFNIESISVGPAEEKELARMTITVNGNEFVARQLVKQLEKLLDVVYATVLDEKRSVFRELALIKVTAADSKTRSDVVDWTNIFRGRVIDVSPESIVVEITGTPDKIDAFIELAKGVGLKELARTGAAALERGSKTITSEKGSEVSG